MLIDSRLEFSVAQALTATAVSTNVVDLGQERKIGPGRSMWVVVAPVVAADDASGNETYQIDVQTDTVENFASPTVIASVTPSADLAAGSRVVIGVPYTNQRYLRLNYTLGGTTPSVTVTSFLTDQEPESWEAQADALPSIT